MNKTTTDAGETPEQLAKNAAELAAWNQFYETCSFFRCDEDNCLLLCRTLIEYFRRDVYGSFPNLEGRFDDPGFEGDFAHFLEGEMESHRLRPETEEKTELSDAAGRKRYKDYVWTCARSQPDAPLKAIRGLMLTGQNSILHSAMEHFLREEVSIVDICSGIPGARVADFVQIDGNDDEEVSLLDREKEVATPEGRPYSVNRWIEEPELTRREKSEFRRAMLETFSTNELAIYLSASVKMLSHPTLCRACGVGKSRIDVVWKKEIVGKKFRRLLESDLPVDIDTPDALRLLRRIAEEELGKEPRFLDFLKAYREKCEVAAES